MSPVSLTNIAPGRSYFVFTGSVGLRELRGPSCQGGFCCIIENVMPATILLVEDNPLARRNMMLFFKTHGYEVLEAQRGEEALRLIRDMDNFDVVITDLRMPGMVDGLEVLRVQTKYLREQKLSW